MSRLHPCHALILCALLPACITGCASHGPSVAFAHDFDNLTTGLTREQVRARLGSPDERRDRLVEASRPRVAGSRLAEFFPLGTPYEQWTYIRGTTDYYVFFASGSGQPRELWRVVLHQSVSRVTPPPY